MKPVASIAIVVVLSLGTLAQGQAPPSAEDAVTARKGGTLAALAKTVDDALRRELARDKPDEAVVVRLAGLRSFAARLAIGNPSAADAQTLDWLVRHPTLGPLLLTALSPRDNPARVLAVLTALRTKFGQAVEQFPELAVATCVVWDSPSRADQTPDQATAAACEVFAHLTRNRRNLRIDPQTLPWPVLVYLVDSHVTPAERRWALDTYRLPPQPGQAYFQVRYDMDGFYSGQWRGGDRQSYTLPNIQRLGGVCKDQAYFAAETCRAYGIPATVCAGQSGAGEGFHAWVGLLGVARGRARWDFQTARYPEHGFWSGTVIDPQTGQTLTDGEVAMSAEWCAVAPAKRLASLALARSLDLVEPGRRVAVCKAALEASPGNQEAWAALVDECSKPQTPPETVQQVAGVIRRFAVGRYDDFAFKSFMTLIGAQKPEEQPAALDQVSRLFPDRPDLLAELALRKGDALRDASRPVDALRLYEGVLETALHYGPLALEAMARVDGMLRPAGKTRELIEHYRVAWTHMTVPEASGYVATTPWYIMGDRYARALEEAGDAAGAQDVRRQIEARDRSKPQQRGGGGGR